MAGKAEMDAEIRLWWVRKMIRNIRVVGRLEVIKIGKSLRWNIVVTRKSRRQKLSEFFME